jgi:hypothetical protein
MSDNEIKMLPYLIPRWFLERSADRLYSEGLNEAQVLCELERLKRETLADTQMLINFASLAQLSEELGDQEDFPAYYYPSAGRYLH